MISYEPLLNFLNQHNIPKSLLVDRKILSFNTLAKLEKNESMSLSTIDKICNEFGLPIEQVVSIKLSDEKINEVYYQSSKEKRYYISNLKSHRKNKKLTQIAIADKLGISQPAYLQWEKKGIVSEQYLKALVNILEIPEEEVSEA